MFFYFSVNQNTSKTLFDWLIIQSKSGSQDKTSLFIRKAIPLIVNNLENFLKSNLVFDLFHGYKDLAGQSS